MLRPTVLGDSLFCRCCPDHEPAVMVLETPTERLPIGPTCIAALVCDLSHVGVAQLQAASR